MFLSRSCVPVFALLLFVAGCDHADTGPTDTPEGVDPRLVLASRGGATYPATGTTASLGRGFDSLQGEVLGDCVANGGSISFAGSEGAAGATSELLVRYARTREELATALGVSVEASATFAFFSASARAKYAQRDDITSDKTFLVVNNEIVNDTQTLKSFQLSPGAEQVLRDKGAADFYQMCGDQFVRIGSAKRFPSCHSSRSRRFGG
jgi:hypothetical protein